MFVTRLKIDSQVFYLPESEDVAALKDRIEQAAQNRAKFVDFTTIGHGRVSVLVTAVIGVRFEQEERTEDELDHMSLLPPAIDLGYEADYE